MLKTFFHSKKDSPNSFYVLFKHKDNGFFIADYSKNFSHLFNPKKTNTFFSYFPNFPDILDQFCESKTRTYTSYQKTGEGKTIRFLLEKTGDKNIHANGYFVEKVPDLIHTNVNFQELTNILSDVILILDKDGLYVDVIPTNTDLLYLPSEQLIGKSIHKVFDKELADYFSKSINKSLQAQSTITIEYDLFIQNKRTWFEGTLSPRTQNTVYFIAKDITDRKKIEQDLIESESRYISLFQDNQVAILITDPTANRIIDANTAATRFYQYSIEELRNIPPEEIFMQKAGELKQQIIKCQKSRQACFEGKHMLGLGKKIEVELYGGFLTIEGRELNYILVHDITFRKKTERELIVAKQLAEQSDRLKSRFLANMSHEIRTPMNAIIGFSELLQGKNLDTNEKSFLNIIHSNSRYLLSLINELVDISKIEAGVLATNPEPVNIEALLYETYQQAKANKIRIRNNIQVRLSRPLLPYNTPIVVDRSRLLQVINNLVENSIKYTREGVIEIGYSLRKKEVLFWVKDSGLGIPEDKLSKIFDRFYQIENETRKENSGTGLGLSICKGIINLLGGEIWAENNKNKGTSFYFTIPLKKSQKQKEEKTIKQTSTLKPKRLVIVEDTFDNYLLLKAILEESGVELILAKTGKEMLDMIKKKTEIDLILMDLRLPDINGLEVTRQIRKTHPKVPIIAQTAFAMDSDRQKALKAGCNDYISKPIEKEVLIETLKKYL